VSNQLLYYKMVVPVTSDRHGDLYVKSASDYDFARHSNSVPVMAVEFPSAALDYAIVFAGTDEAIMPLVILGVDANENRFVDAQGAWKAKHIPAFVRRYPFVFSKSEDGDRFFLCIDEKYSGCNKDGRGERLFDSDGERTQYLNGVLNFVKEYQVQFNRTRIFCDKLRELDLLEPMQAQFNMPSGKQKSLTGFMAVSREKLKALSDEKLAELIKSDEMELIYIHLQSMKNFSNMLNLGTGEKAEADAAPQVEDDVKKEAKKEAKKETKKKADAEADGSGKKSA
jgi:hypothetical protein